MKLKTCKRCNEVLTTKRAEKIGTQVFTMQDRTITLLLVNCPCEGLSGKATLTVAKRIEFKVKPCSEGLYSA